jgi:UDP:flavonoid glycosyltransferase YjiC (YdhE family)
MERILFLSNPYDDSASPILNLANELIHNGKEVTFFSSDEFKKPIEGIGADFKSYTKDLNIFQKKESSEEPKSGLISALLEPMKFIDDIVVQIRGLKFDYAVFSPAYPYANIISQLLGISKTQFGVSN